MTLERRPEPAPVDAPAAVELALEQSHDVKAKVEACAEELASANDGVKQLISDGTTVLSATKTLVDGEAVEAEVQACADDLHGVTDTLAQGVADLRLVEIDLTRSRAALAESQSALATARDEASKATLRALHDSATGLPNRALFDDRLAHGIALAERHDWTLAVMFLDLDRFKSVNDDHGHAAGDLVLKEVARRLAEHARDEDTICRNGGDEFLYLLVNPKGRVNVERLVRMLLNNISKPIEIGGREIVVGSSVGVAMYPDDGTTGEQLIANADLAMYRAKKQASRFAMFGLETNVPAH